MAWTVSGLFVATWIDILDATQEAVDLSLTTHKWALYLTAKTPNYSTDASYNTTSESSGTGYTAGGKDLTGLAPTVTESPAGTLKYDSNDQSWASSSISAEGAELYADALTTPVADPLIVGMWFGSNFVSTNGTFTIQFAAGGIFTIDLTP